MAYRYEQRDAQLIVNRLCEEARADYLPVTRCFLASWVFREENFLMVFEAEEDADNFQKMCAEAFDEPLEPGFDATKPRHASLAGIFLNSKEALDKFLEEFKREQLRWN